MSSERPRAPKQGRAPRPPRAGKPHGDRRPQRGPKPDGGRRPPRGPRPQHAPAGSSDVGKTLPRAVRTELAKRARPGREDDVLRWFERATKLRADGKLRPAHAEALRAKDAAPQAAPVRELLGLVAFALGEWREATQELLAFRRMRGVRDHDPTIADAYRHLGRPERALEFLADLRPQDAGAAVWAHGVVVRADALADTGRVTEGVNLLRAAHRRVPARTLAEARARLEERAG